MDIVQNIQIAAAPADVAAVMFDPAREQEWMTSVTSTTPRTAGITVGAEVDRTSVVAGTADRVGNPGVRAFIFPTCCGCASPEDRQVR